MKAINYLLILLLVFPLLTTAQKGSKKKTKSWMPLSIDVHYGSRLFMKNYYGQLNSVQKPDFSRPVSFAGFGIGQSYYTYWGAVIREASYYHFLPGKLSMQDSSQTTLSGFMSSLSIAGNILKSQKNRSFQLLFGFGLNAGNVKLQGADRNLAAPFITPKLILMPAVFHKHVFVALALEYDHDLFGFKWKAANSNDFQASSLKPLKQTACTAFLKVGYRFY